MSAAYSNFKLVGSGTITTYATLMNTGAGTTAVISSLSICNTGATSQVVRIGIMGSAGTPAVASGEALVWDTTIAANDTVFVGEGITLGNSQYIRCSSDSANINFMAFAAVI